ncbi:MAG: PAS domain-containing protein [Planctomycetota bacterium]|jgi:PAS domain S-box-containing protein
MPSTVNARATFFAEVDGLDRLIETLLDLFADIAFSIKDPKGRYIAVSKTFVERVGRGSKEEVLGLTAHDLFPAEMAARYTAQDKALFHEGRAVTDNLDVTIYRDGSIGWCLTNKVPLRDRKDRIIGLACISKDIGASLEYDWVDESFAASIDYILEHYSTRFQLKEVAARAHLTVAQFERRMKKVFGMTAGQFCLKVRLEAACHLILTTDKSLAAIALECGFCDQSALTKRFKGMIGCTPREYRRQYGRTA